MNDSSKNFPSLKFENWWSNIVFRSPQQELYLSRGDIIQGMRNLAGGAHVSEKWDDSFASLERKNPTGIVFLIIMNTLFLNLVPNMDLLGKLHMNWV